MDAVVDELLRADTEQGWKLDLFVNVDEAFICALCENICRDCIELSCDVGHSDEDFEVYCESCLNSLFESNGRKCPINEHLNPSYTVSRSSRGRILKSQVRCPNSIAYKQSLKKNESDFKEEGGNNSKQPSDCGWNGTLNELVNNHIQQCCENRTTLDSNLQILMMKLIKTEIEDLGLRVKRYEKTQSTSANQIEVTLGSLTVQNNQKLDAQLKSINELRDDIQDGKVLRSTLENRLKQQNREIENLRNSISTFKQQFEDYKLSQEKVVLNLVANASTMKSASTENKNTNNNTTVVDIVSTDGFSQYSGMFMDEFHGSKINVVDGYNILMTGYVSSIRLSQGFPVSDQKNYYWYFKIESASKRNGYHFMGVCSNVAADFSNNPYDGLRDCYGISGNPANVFQGAKSAAVSDWGEVLVDKVVRIEYYGSSKKLLFKFAESGDNAVYTMQLPSNDTITHWYPCMGIANQGNKGFFWQAWPQTTHLKGGGGGDCSSSSGMKKYDGYFEDSNHGPKIKISNSKEIWMDGYISSIRLSKGISVNDDNTYYWNFKIESDSLQNGYHSLGMVTNVATNFGRAAYDGLTGFWGVSGNPKNVFQGNGSMTPVTDYNQTIVGKKVRCEFVGKTKKLLFKWDSGEQFYEMQLPTESAITHWYPAMSLANRNNKGFLLD